MDALEVLRPDQTPHATAYVDEMIEMIGRCSSTGHAYVTDDGVYLDTSTVPDYGLLAGQPLDSLRAGARVEVDAQKRSPLDFALWKAVKPGEPFWDAPFGAGRPGWHTECVVMSLELLGEDFDLHSGDRTSSSRTTRTSAPRPSRSVGASRGTGRTTAGSSSTA